MGPSKGLSGQDPPRGRSKGPREEGGFGGAGSSPEGLPKSTLGAVPQNPPKAPHAKVLVEGAKEVIGAPGAPNSGLPQKGPSVVVTTKGIQEVTLGGLQAPHKGNSAVPSDLETQVMSPITSRRGL